ncbi:MAG TPA: GAF domain-containing protein [Gaiellales bacterium]|jgi:GAF domain-containing protein
MHDPDPPGAAAGLELLLERFRTGLDAERVALEPDDGAAAGADDPRRLRSAVPMEDGRPGVLLVQRGDDSPAFSDAERMLFSHLAGLAETVLRVAAESAQRSRRLAVAQGVSAGMAVAESPTEALAAAVDAIFDNSSYHAVTATLMDRDGGEQVIVADRSRTLRSHTGLRRPIGAGLVGYAGREGSPQLYVHAADEAGFEWPEDTVYQSLLLAPVMVSGRCEAVLELCDTRPAAFGGPDLELMSSVAAQVAGALTRTIAIEESGHRAARLAVGSAVAAALTDARTPSEALALAAHTVYDNSAYELVAATLVLEESREQLLIADLSREAREPERMRRPLDAGIVGAAITSGEPILLGSAQDDPRFDWPHPLSVQSLLVTPVVVDGRCVAALEIWNRTRDGFDRFDVALMQHVADHLAASWRSIRLREESERRAQRLELTLEVTRGVAAATSPEGALAAAVEALARSTAYQAMAAILADRAAGEQMLVAGRGGDEMLPVGLRRPIGEGLTGHVIEHGRPLRIDDASTREDARPWVDEPAFMSMLLMPVLVDGTCVATLELGDERRNRFSDQDMVLLATAAEGVAAALRRIGLRKESTRRADRLALAADLAWNVASAGTVEEALDVAAQTVFERVGYSCAIATLVLPDTRQQLTVADYTSDGSSLAGLWRSVGTGVLGQVIAGCQPLILSHASDHPAYDWPSGELWESMVAVPVMDEGRCRAVLSVYEREPDRLNEDDLRLLMAVAGQVAASLRGIDLRDQSDRRARRLALAASIAGRIASAATVDEALETAATELYEATEYEVVSVIRCQHERGTAGMTFALDRSGLPWHPMTWPIDDGITGRVINGGKPLRLGRATREPDYTWPGPERYESLVQVPVMVDGRCDAVLELADPAPDRYTEDDETLMITVAEQVAAAIRGIALRSEAEISAQRLALTLAAARAVAAADSARAVLETFVRTVHEGVGYDLVEAAVPVEDTDEQLVVASVSRSGDDYTGVRRPVGDGSTGRAFTERRQVTVMDALANPMPGMTAAKRWRSRLATPVIVEGRLLAVLAIADSRPDRFTPGDELFMQTVAEQVGAALLGTRLRDESTARARRLEITVAVAEAIAGTATADQALRAASESLANQIDCGAVTAFLADPETGEQVALVDTDIDTHGTLIEGLRRPAGHGTTGAVFETGTQVRIDRASQQEGYVPWLETGMRYESVLLTPVMVDETVHAVVGLYDLGPYRFERQDELLMQAVAEQIAAALRGAVLQSRLGERAERLERLEQRHRQLLERMVLAQEQERSRVAADLHDDTVQVLSACVIALDRVRRSIEAGHVERAAATLDEVSDLISGAVDRTRRMTFELRPAVLWHNGLEPALRQLLSTVEAEWGMEVTFDASGLTERLDVTLETIAFRSIAELIANARTHSRAAHLRITLSTGDGHLQAVVSDDGRGFDLEQAIVRARATNHLGLEAMMERLDAAGGSIEIDTAPGSGTTVRLSLPVRPS